MREPTRNELGCGVLLAVLVAWGFSIAGANNQIAWVSATLSWISRIIFTLAVLVFAFFAIKRFGVIYTFAEVAIFSAAFWINGSAAKTFLGFTKGFVIAVLMILAIGIVIVRIPEMKKQWWWD